MGGFGDFVPFPVPGGGGGINVPGNTPADDPAYGVFSLVTSVPKDTLTTVGTYVIPATPRVHLLYVSYGGDNTAKYYLELNGTVINQGVCGFGSDLNGIWEFRSCGDAGNEMPPGGILRVKVIHYRPFLGEFYTRMNFIQIA